MRYLRISIDSGSGTQVVYLPYSSGSYLHITTLDSCDKELDSDVISYEE